MPLKEKHKKLLESSSSNCKFIHLGQIKPSLEQVKDANVIIGNIPVDILKNIPNLEFVQLNSAGTNGYSDNPDFPKNVLLANATGAYGVAISECILAGILTLMKHMPSYIQNQSNHEWKDEGSVKSIYNSNILVLGLGDVYLGAPVATPVDPRHRMVTTKYNPARPWTPENAVGIGGAYLCVYGMEGPGGYQFVGRTIQMWNPLRETEYFKKGKPWLLNFFDRLKFYPVSSISDILICRRRYGTKRFNAVFALSVTSSTPFCPVACRTDSKYSGVRLPLK